MPLVFGYPSLSGGGSVISTAPPPPIVLVADRYVSPSGRAGGPGTISDPWSIQYVTTGAGGSIAADVARAAPNNHCYIFVRGGEYHVTSQLNFSNCHGTLGTGVDAPDGKVIIKNFPGEKWLITGGDGADHNFDIVRLVSNYCWIWGPEVYWKTWAIRTNAPLHVAGIYQSLETIGGSKMIHAVVHDVDNGITAEYFTAPNDDGEFYGCISYNCGLDNSQPGGNGHGVYCRHDSPSAYLNIRNHICLDQFGLNYQIYDQSNALNHMRVTDCIGFNAGMRSSIGSGGGSELVCWSPAAVAHHHEILRNRFFKHSSDGAAILDQIGKTGDFGDDIEIAFNYCVSQAISGDRTLLRLNQAYTPQSSMHVHDNFGRTLGTVVVVTQSGPLAYDWVNNEWHRDPSNGFNPGTSFTGWKSQTNLGGADTCVLADPTVTKVFVIPTNKYEYGRAHICYFNWGNLSSIPADMTGIMTIGDLYEIYDVRDLVNPVLTGTYTGAPIQLPITQKPPSTIVGAPTGLTPPTTAPFFNAFVARVTGY